MEHKLENCGRCGLEPVASEDIRLFDGPGDVRPRRHHCPVHPGKYTSVAEWNAAQFAARTERINAAAVALMAGYFANGNMDWHMDDDDCLARSTALITAQDAAARVRWAEMQKGE